MPKEKRIAVLGGGPSAEYDVSIKSAKAIYRACLRLKNYKSAMIIIDRKNKWIFDGKKVSKSEAVKELQKNYDTVFIALHGTFGEDGAIQKLLEKAGIPFTGSGSLASAVANNKKRTKQILSKNNFSGAKILDDVFITKIDFFRNRKKYLQKIGNCVSFPCILKANKLGSSYGIEIVKEKSRLVVAIEKIFKIDDEILAEPFIRGREASCGVFEKGGRPIALPPTEIIPKKADFFDYNSKYKKGASLEITPAKFSAGLIKKIQSVALCCHKIIGCRGMSRTDVILQNGKIYFLEINTIPGMTSTSIYPQQLQAAGIKFENFVQEMIEPAVGD
ncbi:D-alanine--D-alanine ligase [Patescibacteria group bacterium]|nr:D-alanine--D-alanine ligase [Patescibacteria group bacterium]